MQEHTPPPATPPRPPMSSERRNRELPYHQLLHTRATHPHCSKAPLQHPPRRSVAWRELQQHTRRMTNRSMLACAAAVRRHTLRTAAPLSRAINDWHPLPQHFPPHLYESVNLLAGARQD